MKKLFYIGLAGILLFEVLNIYFIMPFPGSQRINSIELAYFLYSRRWAFRIVFLIVAVGGSFYAFRTRKKWVPFTVLLPIAAVVYVLNFQMAADSMFLPAENVILKSRAENTVPGHRLVIGVEHNGDARAYPIEFLTYHHQIPDSIGGKPIMVTYCNVCRTGRVFDPLVNGRHETFRLVGMDHFNAMFEDKTTGSWWYQANGQAIIGKLEGTVLPEIPSRQMTVDKWFALYPYGKVMQPDAAFINVYDSLAKYEKGESKSRLTRTDSLSWKEKSWVVGLRVGDVSKAYDWNTLEKLRIINDRIGQIPVVLALSSDGQSFTAFERPAAKVFTINQNDMLLADSTAYDFSGKSVTLPTTTLKRIRAYQEFWHSWTTFHPGTQRYMAGKTNTDD